jgi:Flp pilus assembly protein TadD
VLSDDKAAEMLKLMTRPPNTMLTPEVAREVCLRTGGKAYIAGAIAALGKEYVLGLKAVNCQSGEILAQQQITASAKEKVLDGLGHIASRLRGELGESLATVQKFDTPLEQATTSSLEALGQYTAGLRVENQQGDVAAIPFCKRAIELDPNFAKAYSCLAASYSNLAEYGLASENMQKAYNLRDRASELERYSISASYYRDVTGELDKANQMLEQWVHNYPRDIDPLLGLALHHNLVGQYDEAVAELQEALRINPDDSSCYLNLIANYVALNRVEDATATYNAALARKLNHPLLQSIATEWPFSRVILRRCSGSWPGSQGRPGLRTFCFPCSRTRRRTLDVFTTRANSPGKRRTQPSEMTRRRPPPSGC